MLKLANLLSKFKSIVIVILIMPLLGIFLSDQFHLELIPENPHISFQVNFEVPARPSDEIMRKVTEPVEKMFNGLPNLIGIESKTLNEKVMIKLRFNALADKGATYLNIQEKMDQIRLILPRDVESYKVQLVENQQQPQLKAKFSKPVSLSELKKVLSPFIASTQKSEPSLDNEISFVVKLDPVRLAQNKLSVSEVGTALNALGVSTTLGRRNGLLIETGMGFTNVEDLKSALIGSVGDRPLRLSDVAVIELKVAKPITEINLWIDESRGHLKEYKERMSSFFTGIEFSYPKLELFVEQSFQPIFLIVLFFFLQFLIVRILHLPLSSMLFFGVMGVAVGIHFIFWKGLVVKPLTVLDLHALFITLLIGSLFLAALFIRIRSYFLKESLIKRPPISLAQAKLFSLVELMPLFLALVVAFWIASLPILTSYVNLPSRAILESIFYIGMPVLFSILAIIPLLATGEFLSKKIVQPKARFSWNISYKAQVGALTGVIIFSVLVFFMFSQFKLYISPREDNQTSMVMLNDLRGYYDHLKLKVDHDININDEVFKNKYVMEERSETSWVEVFEFSASGMRYLPNLDLMSFASSLKDLKTNKRFGFLEGVDYRMPLTLSSELILNSDVPNLLLAKKTNKTQSKALHTLTNKSIKKMNSKILRDNMSWVHIVRDNEAERHGLFTPPESGPQATAWSAYLINQFSSFKKYHLISIVFIFFVFSIYLNSFMRSFLVLLFTLSITGLLLTVRALFPTPFHADSLWLINFTTFISLFQILIFTRIVDVERTRGYDRDLCIQEAKDNIAPSIFLCSWVILLALILSGLMEFFPFLPSLGLWKESLFLTAVSVVIMPFSVYILFPLFYMKSEEAINTLAFKFYRLLLGWKK